MLPGRRIAWLIVLAILLWFLWATSAVLPPFLAGLAIAYLLDPIADRLERHMPRWLATILVLTLFLAVFVGVIVLVVPLFIDQAEALIASVPGLIADLRPYAERWYARVDLLIDVDEIGETMLSRAGAMLATFVRSLLESSLALFNIVAILVIMPVVAFYSLRDFDHLTARVRDYIPPRHAARAERLFAEMDAALGGFIRGQSIVCLSLAVFYAAGWWLTGLDYALVLGVIAGILAFVPYLGAFVSAALALLVGLGQFGTDEPLRLLAIFLVFQVGQMLEGSVLTPNLIGGRIGLHPLWVLFAVFAGGEIAGLWGVFLAVPVAAVLAVLVRAVIRAYRRSAIYGAPRENVAAP